MKPVKLFISHAWDDKEGFVEPLVAALQEAGFEVWYDKFELNVGDSLRQKIDQGLKECDFGVVVLSRHFFAKKWPQAELDGLLALEEKNRKLILPVWKDVGEAEVKEFSPILAGRLGAPTTGGIAEVVKSLRRAVEVAQREAELKGPKSHLDRLAALEEDAQNEKKAQALTQSGEGARIAAQTAEALIGSLSPRIEALVEGSGQQFKLSMEGPSGASIGVKGPYRLRVGLSYRNDCINSAEPGLLRLIATQATDPWGNDSSKFRILHRLELQPHLSADGTVSWKGGGSDNEFSNDQLVDHFLETVVNQIETLHAKHSKKP